MAKIVQTLLLFSRQRKPERRAVDLRPVIQRVLSLRDTQLALSSIRLETAFGDDVPQVHGDPHQLQQVVLNVILNAEQAILGSGWEAVAPATASASPPAPGVRPSRPGWSRR